MKFMSLGNSNSCLVRITLMVLLFLAAPSLFLGQAPTDIQITSAVQQTSVHRLGVNLGDHSYWDSGQILKNLIFRNPGFEGMKYRSILKCSQVTANTCTDDNQYSREQTGFWTGGTYEIISGNSAGITGTVVASTQNPNSCSGCGQIITFDQNINASVGDYFVVANSFPGHGDAGWWDSAQNGATITTETTDLSSETLGKQALVLTATGAGQLASVASYFDSYANLSFIQLNGTFQVAFRAKGIGGNNQLYVNVQRSKNGGSPYLSQTLTLTNTWQDYTLNFSANETGSAVGTVGLVLQATGSAVELDDVSLQQTNSSTANPTAFRDDVVNALKELNPGTIRMMAAGAALGSDLINQIQLPYARYRMGFNSSATEEDDVAYGIHEFLQLCQTVNADPWITIPTATTPQEMTAFIEYLTGNGSDPFSALRISRGQTAPWTWVFNKIHLELGNETWNGDFKGESMGYPAYPQWANQVFGAARATNGFVASNFDLVLDGWSSAPGYTQIELSYSTQHDSVDIAPYLLYSLNNESQTLQFGAMLAEPELWESPGGIVYRNLTYAQTAKKPANLNVYEVNLGSIIGSPTQAQLNATQPSVGAGIAHADHMLQMMRLGVQYQNAFSLPQYEFLRGDGSTVHLWGLVVDMGTTNRRRPQFLTQALANSVIGGTMLQTVQTGANPTWNQPLSSDNVELTGAHAIQSFAFNNNGSISVVLFNLSQTNAYGVTLSGVNAPAGTVQMSQITSANITDNNETSNTVQTATQTLSAFNPATGLSLPPFSMTVLTSNANTVQAPTFSVPAGTYASAQSVSVADATPGATIFYTTDGSSPSASSNPYSGPITVTSTETVNAIATLSGVAPSTVSSATYTITPQNAATPSFSVASGTYPAAQTLVITDSTPSAAIYYTTDGSTPTAASTPYSGPITVSSSETISAIAVATNYSSSAVASASYTINGSAAVPSFSVAAGTYASAQTVLITDATPGAVIYFTTNGTAPTAASTPYSGPITVNSSETISAIAVATNYSSSAVASASYTINGSAAVPSFSVAAGTYASAQTVLITDATPGAVIYFTTNGTAPTAASTPYSGPITVSSSERINAIAVAANYSASTMATANYVINGAAAAPVFSLLSGTYTSAQTVQLSDATAGAAIYYTTNGSAPSTSSTLYTGPITVNNSETISAIATALNFGTSAISTASFTIHGSTSAPLLSMPSGSYNSIFAVSIVDATPGAKVYYTTDGSTPNTSSKVYGSPIEVDSSETLSAVAIAPNYGLSGVVKATYQIVTPAAIPSFSVLPGKYPRALSVKMTDQTAGAIIYYTTNGSTPTAASNRYIAPVEVSRSITLKAIAIAPKFGASRIAVADYEIIPIAAAPAFSIESGIYTKQITVKLSDTTKGAKIYFTTDGSLPTASSNRYVKPIQVSKSELIRAVAIAPNYEESSVSFAGYEISDFAIAPIFTLKPGTYDSAEKLVIVSLTPGAKVYYTTNGTAPTAQSRIYTEPIKISESEEVRAVAIAPKFQTSQITSAKYEIMEKAAEPILSLKAGTYNHPEILYLKSNTPGAKIYYTTNGATPNEHSELYKGAVEVSESAVIKAIAIAPRYLDSLISLAKYEIMEKAAEPILSLKAGTYNQPEILYLKSDTAGAKIYYTTNGSTPNEHSELYMGEVKVRESAVVRAVAIAPKYRTSEISEATYHIASRTEEVTFVENR